MTSLETEITSTKSELETLRAASQLASSNAAAAALVEHEALLKARADLETINAEASALKSAHVAALDELQHRLSTAEGKVKEVERLEVELDAMRREKEETANRISELEIEVLEARDAVEEAEDAKAKAESKAKVLEDDLSKAKVTSEAALEDREKVLLAHLDDAKKEHDARVAELRQEQDKLLSQLATLETELADAQAVLEKASQDQQLATEEHAAKLQSLEESNKLALDDLNAELHKMRNELEVAQATVADIWRMLTIDLEPRRDTRCQGQDHKGGT